MDMDHPTASRTAWTVGWPALAVVLGVSIGWSAAPAWLPSLLVLVAVLLGVVRPVSTQVWASALTVLLLTSTAAGAATEERRLESATLAASAALAHAAAVALPLGLVALARRRRRHRQQGWELARSIAREEQARTESALTQERAAMAGEIHDQLGHRLTLVTLQLGRLSLDPDLPEQARAVVEEARSGVSEAAADLGRTVQLLKAGGQTRTPADRALADIVDQARSAGMTVRGSLPEGLEDTLSAHARTALARVLSESLANAAKHAPGEPVDLAAEVADGAVTLTVGNARRPAREGTAYSSGHGLPSLRHRLGLLGGALRVEDGPDHLVRATVPVDATPRREEEATGALAEVAAARQEAEQHARRARRLAWAVPAGLAAGAVLVTLGSFLYLSVSSTLPPERFARVEVGMPQHEAEELLPSVEMLEAPRGVLPEPAGATCRYHEEAVSLFVREDVFRTCFDDGVVVSTDTIPGDRGAR